MQLVSGALKMLRTPATSPKSQLLRRHVGDGAFERDKGIIGETSLSEVSEQSLCIRARQIHPDVHVQGSELWGKDRDRRE